MSEYDRVPFGLLVDNNGVKEFVAVDEVCGGLACGCICPSCEIPLVAKKGEVYTWHFAHKPRKSKSELDVTCEYSYHVSLVAMAKQLFTNGISINLPTYILRMSRIGYPSTLKVVNASSVVLERIEIETFFDHQFVDVIGYVNNIPLLIYFEHAEKKVDITESNFVNYKDSVRIIKINVSHFHLKSKHARQELADLLLNSLNGKQWIYHPRQIEKIQSIEKTLPNLIPKDLDLEYQAEQQEYQNRIDAKLFSRKPIKIRKNETVEEMKIRLLNEIFGLGGENED